ncbi:MAG: TRAP transporter substrate-binding protein [bacterium]
MAAAAAVFTSALAGAQDSDPAGGREEPVELRIQSLWQSRSIGEAVFERFAEKVETASGDRLVITPLPFGAVVAYNETLEAVGSGLLEGQHTASVYFSGRDAAFGLLGDLNAAYETPYQMTEWMYIGGGLDLARDLYRDYNLYYVGPVLWGMVSIPMKTKVAGVDELEGLKLRMPEGPASDLFRRLGAVPVNIPGSEVYTSLERGVIDGTDGGTLAMNQDLGFHKVARYAIYPGFHSMPVAGVAINLDTWNALTDDLKAILELAVRDLNLDMIQTMAAADMVARKTVVEDGTELVAWPEAERRKVREAASEVWQDYARRSEMARRIYDSHMAYLREIGLLD